ncbi:MAG TPA: HEAT repeat domain-containing protein [Myxococcales bacterium]
MDSGEAFLLFLLFGTPVLAGLGAWIVTTRRDARRLASDAPVPDANDASDFEVSYQSAFDWRRLASELGLEYVPPGGGAGGRLMVGSLGTLGVSVSELALAEGPDRDGSSGIALEVDGRGRIPTGVALRPEGGLDVVRKAVSGEDVLLGDAEFDAGAHVEGPEDQVLAALREPARRAVLPLLTGHRATVKDGVLRVELHGVVDGELVRRMLAGMAETARALCVASVPEALADGARVDPNPEVRLRSLQVLLRTWREHEAAKRAAHAAIIDANPRARLAAARLLADEQAAVALRQLADDATVPAEVRVGALETLLELRPDFLAEALRGWAADEELAETAARAFGTLGDSRAEPVLLGLLSHPRPAAREAAVLSLGQVGTIRAVEPLTALAASGPLRAAAREAIRRVQARLGDAEAGRLSVAPERGAAGAVSLPAEAEADSTPPERVKG